MSAAPVYSLLLVCPDRKGIVAAVAGFLADRDAWFGAGYEIGRAHV